VRRTSALRGWLAIGFPIAAAALLACAVRAASSASQSDRACTATGSNLNGGPANNVFCGTSGRDTLKGELGDKTTAQTVRLRARR
jgi:hypothetical protein